MARPTSVLEVPDGASILESFWSYGSEVDVSLEERLYRVRRTLCVDHLVRLGQSPELAEQWCSAWEREAERRPSPPAGEFWEYGRLWIEAQIAGRRSPLAMAAGR